jgi:hypothetical protein
MGKGKLCALFAGTHKFTSHHHRRRRRRRLCHPCHRSRQIANYTENFQYPQPHIHVNLASARQEEEEEYQRELPVQKTSISLQSLSPPEICIMPQHQQNKPTAYTGL